MKDINSIAVIVSGRLSSTRIPQKMIKPFAYTTLFDIALKKLSMSTKIPKQNIFASVYEPKLKQIASKYNVNIYPRSKESAENADSPATIYEWWNKLPENFNYFILINPCLPLLSLKTIEGFITAFQNSKNMSMFSTIRKKNFIFMDGVMVNHYKNFPPPHNKIMNTLVVPPWQEAAHCLYAGVLKDIPKPEYLGSFDVLGSPELFDIPDHEFYDIDYLWQFHQTEILYKGSQTKKAVLEILPGRFVGPGYPTFIVAEAGCNHQGNISTAKKLAIKAKMCGADAIKFQKRCMAKVFTPEYLNKEYKNKHSFGETYGEHRELLELSLKDWDELVNWCKVKLDIPVFASVWDEKSVDDMDVYTDMFKLSSADLRSDPLITYVLSKNKPLILSTGMSDMVDVEHALSVCGNKTVGLLHCTSTYPSLDEDINLSVIKEYYKRFGDRAVIGYSGHCKGIELVLGAVGMGAKIVEKHFTLDKMMKGRDHSCSLDVEEFKSLVNGIRRIDKAMGVSEKKFLECEKPYYKKLGKSLVYDCNIPNNTVITREHLAYKSPATGLPPTKMNDMVGKRLQRDVKKDELVQYKHLY